MKKLILPSLLMGVSFALAGCSTTNAPASVEAECRVFTVPGFDVRGATRKDQRWISTTQEKGVQVCGWKRPEKLVQEKPVS